MEKKKRYLIIGIVLLIVAILGGTLAWYTWSTSDDEKTLISTNIGTAKVIYNEGSNISADIMPVATKEEGIIKNITVKALDQTSYKLSFNLYLDVIDLPDIFKHESFKYAIYKDNSLIKEGNFTETLETCTINSTSHIVLVEDETITTNRTKYTLYLWIDGFNYTNPSEMQNKTISLKLHASGQNAVLGTQPTTAAQYITNLYTNANKTPVPNGDEENGVIEYNYANIYDIDEDSNTSGGLMSDRLGGTTADLDAGNIRYYGANPNNYINIGDVYEKDTTINNWEKFNGAPPFTESSECYAYFDCSTNYAAFGFKDAAACRDGLVQMFSQLGVSSLDDICSSVIIPKGTPKLYRIIGVFKDVELADGTKQDLIKVIRDESIGIYSWDTSDSTVNGGKGINEWSQADLMKLLNPGYESETVGGSLWWNSSSGTCYSDSNNSTTSCNFTLNGASSIVKDRIASVVWNTGGWNDTSVYSNQMYEYERGINVRSNTSDGVTRTTSWTGKVALMYPSDYGYATDFNSCSSTLHSYHTDGCYNNDWLYMSDQHQWLLIPHSGSEEYIWNVYNNGHTFNLSAASNSEVTRPSFYLNSELVIASGNGTKSSPYVVE